MHLKKLKIAKLIVQIPEHDIILCYDVFKKQHAGLFNVGGGGGENNRENEATEGGACGIPPPTIFENKVN